MKEIDAQIPIVVMTAWGNIDLAVEAIRRGAGDFIQKPWENARLLSILQDADGVVSQPEDGAVAGGGEPDTAGSGRAGLYRVGTDDAAGAGDDGAGGAFGRECLDYRRAWYGQRGGGADAASPLRTGGADTGGGKYRCAAGGDV